MHATINYKDGDAMTQFRIARVKISDSLSTICDQTRPELWAGDNEMAQYDEAALRTFLQNPMNWLVIAWNDERIAGIALCYELLHPDGEHTLYVHELDAHPDYRRQGVGSQVMAWLHSETNRRGMAEVWLGKESECNAPAIYLK